MAGLEPVIDCDVHPYPRSAQELLSYLPNTFGATIAQTLETWYDKRPGAGVFTGSGAATGGIRGDAIPVSGPPGSDPELTDRQLFDEAGVDRAILIPLTLNPMANPMHEAALCSATNRWLADTWLSKYNDHGRYRGSITVSLDMPELAVAEIETYAMQEGFVQVSVPPIARSQYSAPQYFPVFEAAARHGLPVASHTVRTLGMALLTPVGFVSYYFESHPAYTLGYYPHVASLVMGGVFERLPNLHLVCVEGGVSWIAPFMWRLDHYWRAFGEELPLLRKPPSEYIRNQVHLTTQPLDSPPNHRDLFPYLEWMGARQMLLFSSDYPHWDFDDPAEALKRLPTDCRSDIAWRNATRLYQLPEFEVASSKLSPTPPALR